MPEPSGEFIARGAKNPRSDESGTDRDETGKSRDESAEGWDESAARPKPIDLASVSRAGGGDLW